MLSFPLHQHIKEDALLSSYLHWEPLVDILSGETGMSSAGFPYICDDGFMNFINQIPHLFRDGQSILDWLNRFNDFRESLDGFTFQETDSLTRALQVLRTMVNTANVTCLSDLWLLRQVIEVHVRTGIVGLLLDGESIHPNLYAHQKGLDEHQLSIDFHFLHTRGYLEKEDSFFLVPDNAQILKTLKVLSEAMQPLTGLYLRHVGSDAIGATSDIRYIYVLGAIGLFILLLACINFMNLSTARSANRAREVGLRKVLGSNRRQLVQQFMVRQKIPFLSNPKKQSYFRLSLATISTK